MRKIYKTYKLKSLVLHFNINGQKVTVNFKGGCALSSTATYITSNTDIQDALESQIFFNREYYLDRVIEEKQDIKPTASKVKLEPAKEEEIEVVDILDAKTFKNLVELRNALQEKGIDVSQITNVKAAESVAKKNGYNYTVDKNA
jgi:tRNA U34 2-thiouridine synthase MnmA/TrmU